MQFDRIISKRRDRIVYKNGDDCIKVFDNKYSKVIVLSEALNQSRVEEAGLNIPHIKEVGQFDGKWGIVSDYIEGKSLEELMREIPEEQDKLLDKFIDVQMNIQSKRDQYLTKLTDKVNRKINQCSLENDIKLELYTRLESMPRYGNMLHGDLDPSNVIITDDNEIYILDWSHVTQGNPGHDVARTYLLFLLKKQDEIAEKYLNRFCEKSGLDKKQVLRWMPLVAVAQSLNGKQDEWELLKKWIDTVND
ncbi:MAG: DUF1679 domain-containing protein [Erysipelotrichaceae bacterium]|nr:DUF1679 domain-containing protein [Erysipelotrichaceae bacterium]